MKVSRDARRVLDALLSVSGEQTFTPEDAWIAERLVYSFYPKIIIGHIKKFYNPKSKNHPECMAFYEKPTRSQNFGRRRNDDWEHDDTRYAIWLALSNFAIADYSYDDLVLIKNADIEIEDINYGIKIGLEEKVYKPVYAIRVAEQHKAERDRRRAEIHKQRELVVNCAKDDINRRTRIEIAGKVADWQEELENLELQHKVKRLFGEE